jgi:hypothetical protein
MEPIEDVNPERSFDVGHNGWEGYLASWVLDHSGHPCGMTVREMLATLQHLPRDAEVLAFEAGCEEYCEREVDDYLAS